MRRIVSEDFRKKKSDGLREDSVSSCRCRNMYINLSDNVRSDTIATSKLLILCIWIAIFDSSVPKFQILIVKRPCYFMLKYFKSSASVWHVCTIEITSNFKIAIFLKRCKLYMSKNPLSSCFGKRIIRQFLEIL